MPASEARIAANRKNAALSTGPKTVEGKEQSRANSYKHGLTGAGKVLPELEAEEVRRRAVDFARELKPTGAVGLALVNRAATMSVRIERCVEHEKVALTERVRRAIAEFVPPEGVDDATAARLRAEAGTLAVFDPGPEAILARRYEAAAERSFLRCLKELRLLEKAAKAAEREAEGEALGSFDGESLTDDEFDALEREYARMGLPPGVAPARNPLPKAPKGVADVAIGVARRR